MAELKTHSAAPRQRLSVLVAEDNPVMQALIKSMLHSWGYEAVLVHDGAQAWKVLEGSGAPRMAMLDWMMPGIDGVELCRRIRDAGREPYTYILLISGRSTSADLIRAMDAGADDYVTKPFEAQELRVRLNAGRRIVQLQEQLVAARETLREQAAHDDVTGLLNHGYILAALDREIERARREARPVGVLLADIDRFRQINETFGHVAGDEVLQEIGRRLQASAPPEAMIGRYGGEEFLIVLPRCDNASTRLHAERIRDAVGGKVFTAGAASFPVTCSIGTAAMEAPNPSGVRDLLRCADEALFWAKREGRSQISPATTPAEELGGAAAAS